MKGIFAIRDKGHILQFSDYNDIPKNFENLVKFEPIIPISSAFSFIIRAKFSSDPAIPSAKATHESLPDAIIIPFNRFSTDTSSFIIMNIDE